MTTPEPVSRPRPGLAFGGLLALAGCALASFFVDDPAAQSGLLAAGLVVACVGVGAAFRGTSRVRHDAADAAAIFPAAQTTGHEPTTDAAQDRVARAMVTDFRRWLREHEGRAKTWSAFDQFVRETLAEHLGAARVRCYHVQTGSDTFRDLAQLPPAEPASGASLCTGVLGHVAATGYEYVARGPGHGELLEQLAAEADEHWDWVWPVRRESKMVGLVAIGTLPDAAARNDGLRQTVIGLAGLFWEHIALAEDLRVAQRTDRGSGVLNRGDFFETAARALRDSYEANEPVVVVTFSLEGLRHLDDGGRWQQRDALVEDVGHLLAGRVRADDLVGRFSDDRFVVLLRRLDAGLGRLIAEQVLTAAQQCIVRAVGASDRIRIRGGIAASDLEQPPLETLLVDAFRAAEAARTQGRQLCDAAEPAAVEPAAVEVEYAG